MIQMLGGNAESVAALTASIGKKIEAIELKNDVLELSLEDKTILRVSDEGQSCCESRYMKTDDDMQSFVGDTLRGLEIKEAPNQTEPDDWGDHEVQFLEVQTDKGCFTMASHNEHNGYYGGFYIQCSLTSAK